MRRDTSNNLGFGSVLLQLPWVIALAMPLFYYPLALALRTSLEKLSVQGPQFQSVAALAIALSVIASSGWQLMRMATNPRFHGWGALAQSPLLWGLVAITWVTIATIASPGHETAAQNLLVYGVSWFLLMGSIWGLTFVAGAFYWLSGALIAVVIGSGLVGVIWYPIFEVFGLNARVFAMYGVLAMASLFAYRIRAKWRVLIATGIYFSLVVSQSRMAALVALIVAVIGLVIFAKRPWRVLIAGTLTAALALVITLRIPFIAERTWAGNLKQGWSPVNDSGRWPVWVAEVQSWLEHPWLGQGAGSSQTVASQVGLEHPHQEILRILHDAGVVGLFLAGVFVFLLLKALWPRRASVRESPLSVPGFLVVLAALVGGQVENFLVFPSVMWPAATIVALALASRTRQREVGRQGLN